MNIDKNKRIELQSKLKESKLDVGTKELLSNLLDDTKLGLKLYFEDSLEEYEIDGNKVNIDDVVKNNYLILREKEDRRLSYDGVERERERERERDCEI